MVRLHCSNQKELFPTHNLMLNVRSRNSCIDYHYGRNIAGHFKRWKSKSTVCASENHSLMNVVKASLKIFHTFMRPYAYLGTVSGIISGSLMAIEKLSDISPTFLVGLCTAEAAFFFMMIYYVGVNQLFDIEIDKVNKPYLPLASGEMNLKTGIGLVTVSALMAFFITYIVGSRPLQYGIFLFFLLGSAYSVNLPLLRWKTNTIGALLTLLLARGIIIQLSPFFHIQNFVLGRQAYFSRTLACGAIVVSIFSGVIAIYKDMADIEGDQKFGFCSFAANVGIKQVFWIAVYLLEMAYAFAIVFGATSSHQWSKLITIFCHAILAAILWKQAQSVDLKNKSSIQSFYMLIWKLLYTEHLLIPFVR